MKQDPTSLDRLHDIVLPEPVSWWPLAPGWYAVIGLGVVASVFFAWRAFRYWKKNAYRRAALHELSQATSTAQIALILRRAALAMAPRESIASATGDAWVDWLERQGPDTVSANVRRELVHGIYRRSVDNAPVKELQQFAVQWISHHRNSDRES